MPGIMRVVSGASALLLAVSVWFGGAASAADPLASFPTDPKQVSVAGISSGAFMANQLHIAHSAGLMGAGIIAGGLYGCAVDSTTSDGVLALASIAVGPCLAVPTLLKPVTFYSKLVNDFAARGWIDPPANLANSHIYVFTGQSDKIVNSKTVELAVALYEKLGVPSLQISMHDKDLPSPGAGHSWVTANFGIRCDENAPDFINDCHYDQAGAELATIYGPLKPRVASPAGRVVAFDQTEFAPSNGAAANGLSDTGYLYIPKSCEAGAAQKCRLHIVLHGCMQSAEVLGPEFYTHAGINEWADGNNIVVLYPQAHATTVSQLSSQNFLSLFNTNLEGCWNWWGYGGDTRFLTKKGVQINAISSMVRRVTGQ
jgi:poly(3-hydroxybutyrate) depolymerase